MEIQNIVAKHREASNFTGTIFSNIRDYMESERQQNESLSLGRWVSRVTPGRLGRRCREQTPVSYQLQQQPPGFTWAPLFAPHLLEATFAVHRKLVEEEYKVVQLVQPLGGKKMSTANQKEGVRGNTITCQNLAKRAFQTLLRDLSAA